MMSPVQILVNWSSTASSGHGAMATELQQPANHIIYGSALSGVASRPPPAGIDNEAED